MACQADLARQAALQEVEDAQEEVDNAGHNRRGNRGREPSQFHKYVPHFDDDDDPDIDKAGSIVAIVPPPLPAGAKFDIISMMIQLLNINGVFSGNAAADANPHLMSFI